jgi:hypothetical protein
LHTVAGRARGLRDSALGKVALLVAVLAVAFVASQSCASRETEITKEEAVAIASNEVDYEPDRVMTRFIPRGVQSRPNWAVSLSTVGAGGRVDRATVVVIDGRTGDIVEKRVAVD